MIKVVLWDVDGTLLDFKQSEKYAIKKCFELFSIGECTDEMLGRYSKINEKYWKRLELGEITKQQVLTERFQEFFKSEGIDFDRIEDFNNEYQVRLGDKAFFCDNGYDVVKSLKGKVKQYAVTNGTYIAQTRKLALSGLIDLFDDVFISDKIGFEKPTIEFFKVVEDKIGEFKREETLIIGDSLTSDMRGGNNADILCCWYNPQGKKNDYKDIKTDYEIENLDKILEIIK